MHALTKRQSQVLELVQLFTQAKGYPPSYRELMQALNLTSPATIHKHIQTLKKLGHLKEGSRGWRNVKVAKVHKAPAATPLVKVAIIGAIQKGQKPDLYAKSTLIEVPQSLMSGVKSQATLYGFVVKDSSFADELMQAGDILIVEARDEAKPGELILATSKQHGTVIARAVDQSSKMSIQGVIISLVRKF